MTNRESVLIIAVVLLMALAILGKTLDHSPPPHGNSSCKLTGHCERGGF
jgi:hypothetical protein